MLLALLLLLCGCGARFSRAEDGTGYTDTKTDVYYTAWPSYFEAASRNSEALGEYEDKKFERTISFYEIPELPTTRFLSDGDGYVYCADAQLPDASAWRFDKAWVCEEDAISVASGQLTEAAVLSELTTLWFSAQECELPMGRASFSRRLKLCSPDYPNLYYCFSFYVYENGEAYFYEAETRHTVRCPGALADTIKGEQ